MSLAKRLKLHRYTPQEYYDLELTAEHKGDYIQGGILRWRRGGKNYSRICSNISREVGNRLQGTNCTNYGSDLRVEAKASGLRTYPAASVFCEQMEVDPEDPQRQTYTNPVVVFEVLPKGKVVYQLGLKCDFYREIESLRTIALIWEHEPRAIIHERQVDGSWTKREMSGLDSSLAIESLRIKIPMSELYDQVDLDAK